MEGRREGVDENLPREAGGDLDRQAGRRQEDAGASELDGHPVLYGHIVQLRHVQSYRCIAMRERVLANLEPDCLQVELADGRTPHSDARNVVDLAMRVWTEPPPTLDAASGASDALRDFLARALVKEPSSRPSAAELRRHPFVANARVEPRYDATMDVEAALREGRLRAAIGAG